MPLFGRHRGASEPEIPAAIPGLAGVIAAMGFAPATGRIFDGHLEQAVHDATPAMYGIARDTFSRKVTRIGDTVYGDAYRGTVDGRVVTIANAWTNIGPELRSSEGEMKGVGICAVELPSILSIAYLQPRQFENLSHLRAEPTGDAAFDQRFVVFPVTTLDQQSLPAGVLQQIMAHDDWAFCAERYLFGCISKGAFRSADEVTQRIDEVLHIVAAFPESMLPAQVDHAQDDLIEQISHLTSIEETLAFLQQVTPEQRTLLAQSDTPLAAFADVRTPEAARERFASLDQSSQMQVLAMFMKVKDQQSGT